MEREKNIVEQGHRGTLDTVGLLRCKENTAAGNSIGRERVNKGKRRESERWPEGSAE